jgi:hypothetical protein
MNTYRFELTHTPGTNLITIFTVAYINTTAPDTRLSVTSGYEISCPSTPVDSYQSLQSDTAQSSPGFTFKEIHYPLGHMHDNSVYSSGYPMVTAYNEVVATKQNMICKGLFKSTAALGSNPISFTVGGYGASFTVTYGGADAQLQTVSQLNVTLTPPADGGGGAGPCPTVTANMVPTCDPDYDDPLLIDLGQDGIHLGPAGVTVLFDMLGNGNKTKMQWLENNGNDAFLVHDLNQNGRIDDGTELFGNGTVLHLMGDSDAFKSPNGFVALAQFDQQELGGNDDGFISADDEIWSELQLWLDIDANGQSTETEIMSLDDVGLTHLDIIPKENNRTDPAGNLLPLWSWSYNQNINGHNKFKMVDVFFKAF